MAKFSSVCDCLSVCLLTFWTIQVVCATSKDYYLYNGIGQSDSYVSLSLQNGHHVQKRSTKDRDPLVKENKFPPTTTPPAKTTPQDNLVLASDAVNNGTEDNMTTEKIPLPPPTYVSTEHPFANNNQTGEDEEDISISKFSDSTINFNETLKQHNIKTTQTDNHKYYNSSIKTDSTTGDVYWVNMTDNMNNVKVSELLSTSHRRAATVKLNFEFPFYGHILRNVTIATGGFLYTGDYVHSWLAATQYIAPLMANFDTSLSNDSYIKYVDNGTALTVLWENVLLQESPNEGKFTFQATLHSNGDIVFVYQNVPVIIENIQDDHHPVKVGLSDAYIIDRTIFFVRRKTIYEYHRVNFRKQDIKNGTVIYLKALPTCPTMKDCTTCLTKEIPSFKCTWCPTLNKCSDGIDRNKQEWLSKSCDKKVVKNSTECSAVFPTENYDDHDLSYTHDDSNLVHVDDDPMKTSKITQNESKVLPPATSPVHMNVSSIIPLIFIVALVAALGVWIMYAYRNPHTTSGQMLIRYRPSQWSWRRGEARYTAATIHM
ncbi:PREDICTED: plexin domain-containing protein 2 [Nicrophorus vespilloides]|uniref:Plexin domain-containing protein 2 n=1 Tax=Nicrophorus vespilloides TaxID=110193 RepID=A0ABM1MIG1_NICVS|nr:PREDICTED: plexin domain-containing protein 2 [Nicrophorus vespilloides]